MAIELYNKPEKSIDFYKELNINYHNQIKEFMFKYTKLLAIVQSDDPDNIKLEKLEDELLGEFKKQKIDYSQDGYEKSMNSSYIVYD